MVPASPDKQTSALILCIACVSIFWDRSLLCNVGSMTGTRNIIDFQFVQPFLLQEWLLLSSLDIGAEIGSPLILIDKVLALFLKCVCASGHLISVFYVPFPLSAINFLVIWLKIFKYNSRLYPFVAIGSIFPLNSHVILLLLLSENLLSLHLLGGIQLFPQPTTYVSSLLHPLHRCPSVISFTLPLPVPVSGLNRVSAHGIISCIWYKLMFNSNKMKKIYQ